MKTTWMHKDMGLASHIRHHHVVMRCMLTYMTIVYTHKDMPAPQTRHHHATIITHRIVPERHDTSVRTPQACTTAPCFWTGQTCTTPVRGTAYGHTRRLTKRMVAPRAYTMRVVLTIDFMVNQDAARRIHLRDRLFSRQKSSRRLVQGGMTGRVHTLPLILEGEG